MQPRMLRTDQCIVEARRNGVRQSNLSFLILQQIAEGAMQYTRSAAAEARRMLPESPAAASGLHANHPHVRFLEERVEQPNRVAAAAHARDQGVGKAPNLSDGLPSHLFADHLMEIAHHHRVRMCS